MPRGDRIQPLDWRFGPDEALRRWRGEEPLLALVSGDREGRFGRWSVMAPRREIHTIKVHELLGSAELLDAMRTSAGQGPVLHLSDGTPLPFSGGWIGFIGYECGRLFEPRVAASRPAKRAPERADAWPDAMLCRVPRALLYSHQHRAWFEVGDPDAAEVSGCIDGSPLAKQDSGVWRSRGPERLRALDSAGAFAQSVARAVEFVRSGDIYQANITQPFAASIEGSPRAFAIDSLCASRPRYGAYLELDSDRSLLSFSPELYLCFDSHTRRVITRPMKGTRPASGDPAQLLASTKDAAELTMIVDLMRNDLGRLCETGSVIVENPRSVEHHPTVLQTVAEVSGTLASGYDAASLVAASFPPGSVTGAPKVRAMQVIDELESRPRGPYCGAVGMLSSCGSAQFSVAIRTAAMTRSGPEVWEIDYRAGCGIVAESDPEDEERECLDKTRILVDALEHLGRDRRELAPLSL